MQGISPHWDSNYEWGGNNNSAANGDDNNGVSDCAKTLMSIRLMSSLAKNNNEIISFLPFEASLKHLS